MLPTPIALFHAAHSPEMERAALDVLRSGQIASGPKVAEFQTRFGELVGSPHVVCTSDMTSALVIALRLAGIERGDEVLTLAYSCMSSNAPIALLGARAVWVDVDPATASMSVDDFKRALTSSPRAKAVLLYHVAGYPGPAAEIAALCKSREIVLIEDCNNALGATQQGVPVGQVGDYAVFSFYPNRQINSIEGGALVCPDSATAARATRLRRFGIDPRTFRDSLGEISAQSNIAEIGWSAGYSQLNAAIALEQMPLLQRRLDRTRLIAAKLRQALAGQSRLSAVLAREDAEPSYWGFLALVDRRDEFIAGLKQRGIHSSRLHHRNDDYSGFGVVRRPLPGTDRLMGQVVAIPCGWWLDDDQVAAVIAAVRAECEQ